MSILLSSVVSITGGGDFFWIIIMGAGLDCCLGFSIGFLEETSDYYEEVNDNYFYGYFNPVSALILYILLFNTAIGGEVG